MDWRKIDKQKAESMVIREAQSFRPDLAFCQFQAPVITSKLPRALRDLGCFTVNWSGDVRSPLPEWYKACAPYFDVTSFTNLTDVEEIRLMGHRSEFLQIGYEERLYFTSEGPRSGVVFIGNNYGGARLEHSSTRRGMVKAMHEAFGEAFAVYGMSWDEYGGSFVREPSDAEVLRGSLVAVGMDHFFRPGFASDRLLRATACGCAVVQWHYEGIEHEHPHVIAVKSMDEMVNKVSALLGNPDEARRLGALNAANTLMNHRWDNRVPVVESWMP